MMNEVHCFEESLWNFFFCFLLQAVCSQQGIFCIHYKSFMFVLD